MTGQDSGSNRAVKWGRNFGRYVIRRPLQRAGAVRHGRRDLDHAVDVALGVDAARQGEPHQLHLAGSNWPEAASFPNITDPISHDRIPPSRYSSQASACPG